MNPIAGSVSFDNFLAPAGLDRLLSCFLRFENSEPKLKTKFKSPNVGHDFSFKFSTFGTLPKSGFQVFKFLNGKLENQADLV